MRSGRGTMALVLGRASGYSDWYRYTKSYWSLRLSSFSVPKSVSRSLITAERSSASCPVTSTVEGELSASARPGIAQLKWYSPYAYNIS